ncbi:SusC/RagA family TonB-linked outer membrane protein [Phocaeicola coprocola]|jgi:TonB-dependent starch-binding outer membrane protein SusC|uniref:SusC/RagA family TonB-linked outer membrane protein n=1 Tax=Phocaeicola coprocola TaxID=310298 RepID=UPI0022E3B0AB|nr:TonB-dependent receptor [Phocaeicola coprocola]
MNRLLLLRRVYSTFLLSMFCVLAFAQGKQITGVIKDGTGEPMIGVNVLVKGTTNGTITDFDGKFAISDVKNSDVLTITYVGYVQQSIPVGNQTSFNIILKEDTETLDEVVVIGYGTVKKRDLTGSVASVSNETLTANPVSDVSQALQGKLAGVSVTSQDGRPGAEVSIRVRGGGSITQSNDPLFIVDGFPVSSISDIPADQIETIDVLKDASSTAIYGARGANGVILVTTKGAKTDKLSVTYNGYVQTKAAAKTLDPLSAQDYVKYQWAYADALSGNGDGVAKYFGLGAAYGNHFADYANVDVHDWTDDMLRNAIAHTHNLSISGGSEKTKFVLNVNYLNDEGIKINSGYNRFNTSLKLNQELLKNLKLDVDIRYSEDQTTGKESSTNGKGSLLSGAYRWRPIDNPLGDPNALSGFAMGADNIDAAYGSPVDWTNDVQNIARKQRVRSIAALSWDIIEGLTLRAEVGAGRNWGETKYYENGLTQGHKVAKLTRSEGYNLRNVNTLNYQVQGLSDKHSLSFLLGQETIVSKSNSTEIEGHGYPAGFDFDQAFGMIDQTDKSLAKDKFSNSIGTPDKTVSFFARANYSLLDRYLLTVTFRADGSSKFAPNHRWGYFPAGALAWRLSDESFMEGTRSWLDNLKLRLSYGMAGADNIDASLWRETWESTTVTFNGQTYSGYKPSGMLSNPDLKWETTISRNIGLDFGFFNNRLSGTIDAYWNTTKDLLMCIPIDETTGYSYQYQNIGQTSNKGIEIALNYDILRTKDFTLGVSATYNYNHNNIDELADNIIAQYGSQWASNSTTPTYDYEFREGKSVGLIRGYICDGYYTTADFNYDPATQMYTLKPGVADLGTQVGNYPNHYNLPEGQVAFPGAIKLRDLDGNGVAGTEDVADLGEITHPHTGGFNLNMTWKDIDFSAGFAWAAGGHVYNVNSLINMYGQKDIALGANKLEFISDCYQIYDIQNGELVRVVEPDALDALNTGAKYGVPYMENGTVLSTFVEDASFLRLNTLTIGYTFPKAWTKKIGMQRARVYATAGNLFTITGYSGIDPEVNADPNKSTTAANTGNYPLLGMDYGTYPRARTFTFGVNITF